MGTSLWNTHELELRATTGVEPAEAPCSATGLADRGRDAADQIELIQLVRLATAILAKSTDDLSALRECNPELLWEWLSEFRQRKLEAEANARLWSAAMAALTTAPSSMQVRMNE